MSTRFFTNRRDNTLIEKFAGVFANNPDILFFDALVGYFRSSGYFALRPHLEKLSKIRILVGIDVDARSALCQERGMLFDADAPSAIATFMAAMKKKLPIPAATPEQQAPIVALVERILDARSAAPSADVSALESEIDRHVHALYHLAPEEVAIVEGNTP